MTYVASLATLRFKAASTKQPTRQEPHVPILEGILGLDCLDLSGKSLGQTCQLLLQNWRPKVSQMFRHSLRPTLKIPEVEH